MSEIRKADCTVDIHVHPRPKNREPVWTLDIHAHGQLVFSHTWLKLICLTQDAAQWLADLIVTALDLHTYIIPQGHTSRALGAFESNCVEPEAWSSLNRRDDDVSTLYNGLGLHVEHLCGPLHHGIWWAGMSEGARTIWSTHEHAPCTQIRLRHMTSACWLTELVARVHLSSQS